MKQESWLANGQRQFASHKAREIAGIQNRQTWNNYLLSIGLPEGRHNPVLSMSELIWVWVIKLWMAQNARRSNISTHETFRVLRQEKGWTLDDFLDYLQTDLLTITIDIRKRINNG